MSQDPEKAIHKNSATSQAAEGGPMEGILAQWRRERPDIDPAPMAVCGEVWRAGEKLRQGVLNNIATYNLDFAGMDVLLTLRRQGRGETLSPSLLAKDMMLSTSAMTNRLDRLEKRGLVERRMDPNDRRGQMVALTTEGFDLANEVVVTHVETEEKLLSNLSPEERQNLRFLLEKIA
ncbi:MarR family transcriptional regulator [Kiloniella litopenaei]|uniref:MarR family transcriptional regulator n=1 Tax=Kiloniella litopenaei TaxID=1549748 RepID=A0A0M2R823_9PROT|nr:MarR family transcriptional regulator [Kiloniella litopenaei]KKJ76160.1 MarR family transcriptional regulator [Kiloniella litopenaei]